MNETISALVDETTYTRESAENAGVDVRALDEAFGPDNTPCVLDFLKDKAKFEPGKPGVETIYTGTEDKPLGLAARFLGKTPEATLISPMFAIPVGTLFYTNEERLWRGIVYLDGNGNLWAHEDAVAADPKSSAGMVTKLGQASFYKGEFYQHHESRDEWAVGYQQDEIKFREKPIAEVLKNFDEAYLKALAQ